MAEGAEARPYSLQGLATYFLGLGAFGFGGPIALAGYMQRDLVERRRWISEEEYVEGLALSQLAPGPLAAQLAMYLGWVRAGVLGATVVSVAFILPSFVMVLALSWAYLRFGGLAWMQGAFYGIGAAVIAIIARSAFKLVPFLHGGVVLEHRWLTERQFLDAVAVAMITPGPVVITVAFIGYLVAGPAGATVAALGVFLSCYLFVVVPAPYFRRYAKNPQIKAFVSGVTAAATGAIAGAGFVLARRAIVDVPTVCIAGATLAVLFSSKRVPEPLVIVAAGAIGLVVRGLS